VGARGDREIAGDRLEMAAHFLIALLAEKKVEKLPEDHQHGQKGQEARGHRPIPPGCSAPAITPGHHPR
jgi:hypothetical protein